MKIERNMDLDQLAERMGNDATREEAAAMRDELVKSEYEDTADIPSSVFALMMSGVYSPLSDAPARFVAARGNRTQTQLAELLDVSRATIQNWENGRVAIPRIAWLAMQSLPE